MDKILQSFKDKRFRYGSFSTVMIVVVIGLFILVNLVVDRLNISYDLTQEQLFSLSQGSINIIRDLDADVTIYSLFPTGQEQFLFQQLLEDYASHSNRITVINRDPLLHPQFVESFARPDESIAIGSIIVVGPDRHRVIHATDLVTTQFDMNTWQNRVVSFNVEPQVTNAINFVVAAETPIIYRVVGNNEPVLPPALIHEMEMAGYEVREVNLLTQEVPDDASLLFITFGERDWSPDQAERVREYLQNDGRAIFALGYRTVRFPMMDEVLAAFGIRVGDYIIIEGSTNHFHMNNPLWLLPEFVSGEVTDDLITRNFIPFIENSTGIDILDLRRANTRIEPLIQTSNLAYGRVDTTVATVSRIQSDVSGPFNIAVSVEDSLFLPGGQPLSTRMVVIAGDSIMGEVHNSAIGGTNWNFLINSLNWLREEPNQIFIPTRPLPQTMPLLIPEGYVMMITIFSVIVLPLAFGITGLVVWLRRRNA
ncbi:MAG: GldG family protein [Defluviitaleaceae bacterium]|nr:GldG family protein [Defluviitaleaceae bacterium]